MQQIDRRYWQFTTLFERMRLNQGVSGSAFRAEFNQSVILGGGAPHMISDSVVGNSPFVHGFLNEPGGELVFTSGLLVVATRKPTLLEVFDAQVRTQDPVSGYSADNRHLIERIDQLLPPESRIGYEIDPIARGFARGCDAAYRIPILTLFGVRESVADNFISWFGGYKASVGGAVKYDAIYKWLLTNRGTDNLSEAEFVIIRDLTLDFYGAGLPSHLAMGLVTANRNLSANLRTLRLSMRDDAASLDLRISDDIGEEPRFMHRISNPLVAYLFRVIGSLTIEDVLAACDVKEAEAYRSSRQLFPSNPTDATWKIVASSLESYLIAVAKVIEQRMRADGRMRAEFEPLGNDDGVTIAGDHALHLRVEQRDHHVGGLLVEPKVSAADSNSVQVVATVLPVPNLGATDDGTFSGGGDLPLQGGVVHSLHGSCAPRSSARIYFFPGVLSLRHAA